MLATLELSFAQGPSFGAGLRAGAGRIDGDVKKSTLKPFASGIFTYSPVPHLALGLEAGVGEFFTDDVASRDALVRIVPVELDFTFHFSPYRKISPFASLGAGWIFWHNFEKEGGQGIDDASERDAFALKTAGGMEITLSRLVNLSIGAALRYSQSDLVDLDGNGDEDDALVTVFSGLTFKFGKSQPDIDRDGILDRYDLDSQAKEDRDGYMDHDGVPDTQISSNLLAFTGSSTSDGIDDIPPIVIHSPVRRAAEGRDLTVRAEVYENRSLLKSAVLYRPLNFRRWLVQPMTTYDNENYEGTIPGSYVQLGGLEYCVVAVDQAISGLGYSGLPKRPNFVEVNRSETLWQILTGVAAAGGWGAATYIVARNQEPK